MKIGEKYQRGFYDDKSHFRGNPKCLFIVDYTWYNTPWIGENIIAQAHEAVRAWRTLPRREHDRIVYTQGDVVELFISDNETWGKG